MGISVLIRKKSEDDKIVAYYYGGLNSELGEFIVNKKTLEVNQIKKSGSSIDNIMYLSSVSKIIKIIKANESLPDVTSYNS